MIFFSKKHIFCLRVYVLCKMWISQLNEYFRASIIAVGTHDTKECPLILSFTTICFYSAFPYESIWIHFWVRKHLNKISFGILCAIMNIVYLSRIVWCVIAPKEPQLQEHGWIAKYFVSRGVGLFIILFRKNEWVCFIKVLE